MSLSPLSLGYQKQRRLPGVDLIFPGYVLFLSPLPGLVRQLTWLASVDSVRQETIVRLAHNTYDITETEHTVYPASVPQER